MDFPTQSSPHLPVTNDVSTMMRQVILALVPGALLMFWFFGWGVIVNLLVTSLTALAAEASMMKLRRRPVMATLADGSALLTALLLGLALPPLAPWWIAMIGTLFAIIVAKQLYGGLGYNPFNPAMAGYVVLIISFPLQMTMWSPPLGVGQEQLAFVDTLRLVFTGSLPAGVSIDSVSMATPLDHAKTQVNLNYTWSEIRESPLYSGLSGHGWEWVSIAFLLGGLWMLKRGAIEWRIPVAMLSSMFVISLLFYLADSDSFGSPLFHLFSGATMIGAFFIATDPVSGATTPRGRIYFGAGVGVLTYIIRTWGGYPDGVAFAILLMNMAAPTIDYYTQPRVFGHSDGDS